jgi:DNA-binding transcriptional LysR family regulator
MELRHLRYFVAVAEELSFTRAARRVHIGQPPLSHQIQALEEEIGARLLDRSRHHVRLTEAGTLFLEDARRILALSAGAADTARRAERGELGRLRIGFIQSMAFTAIFPKVINCFRKQFPHVTLQLQELSTMRQIEALNDRSLDVGFMRPMDSKISAGLHLTTLHEYGLAAVLPLHHRMARCKGISIKDLQGEDFIMFPFDEGTTLAPQVRSLCREAGFEPQVVMEAREVPTIIGLIAAGCGVTILPELFKSIRPDDVCFRRLDDPALIQRLVLGSRDADASQLTTAFCEIAIEAAQLAEA